MKKTSFLFFIVILLLSLSFYFFFSKGKEEREILKLKNLLQEYADATYLFSAILNTNPEKVSFEDWKKFIEENKTQWEKLEKESKEFLENLEKESQKESFILPVFAAEEVELGIPKEVLEKELENIFREGIKITAEEAPRGEKIKSVMETFNLSAKEAQKILEDLYQTEAKEYENKAKFYGKMAKISKEVKDISFLTVAAGGVILSGGEVLAAKSILAKGVGYLTLSLEGADLALAIGEKGAEIIDNRKWQTAFSQAQENLGVITNVLAFVELKEGLKKAGNLITIYNFAETANSFLKEAEKIKGTPINYTLSLKVESTKEEKVKFSLKKDKELYQNYFLSSEKEIFDKYLSVFPEGSYLINGREIEISKTLPKKEKEASKETPKETFESPEKFYQKYCQIVVPIWKKQGMEMSIEDCVQQQVSSEKQLYQSCLEEGNSEKECQKTIENWREFAKKVMTKSGCREFWKGFCSGISEKTAREKCESDMQKTCQDLPEK